MISLDIYMSHKVKIHQVFKDVSCNKELEQLDVV